ncbi:MAG TPA: DUF3037 domain-containing protein [Allosphingosinicella sp.]|jgi:hypothetical protein
MERCYSYAVARFVANRLRDERLNIAVVVFKDDGLDVRLPKSLDKLHAISAALDVQGVRDAVEQLYDVYTFAVHEGLSAQEKLDAISPFAAVDFSMLGEFRAASSEQYENRLTSLVRTLVEPEPALPRQAVRRPSRLLNDIKSAFRSERVMARKGEGLEAHRILQNYKVAEGLPADLILKNGAMHIVETVDASASEHFSMRMIYSIGKAAMVFEQARMQFGEAETKARLVYKATSSLESFITPTLEAAEHQGAVLINWESRDDRTQFIVDLSSLAEPLANVGGQKLSNVHASVQPKFKLN